MEELLALLNDHPNDVDFSLFEFNRETQFVKEYFDKYGQLPSLGLFLDEMGIGIEEGHEIAPWKYYEDKLRGEKFIRDALPALTAFNREYDADQK